MLLTKGRIKVKIVENAEIKITINGKDYSRSSFVRCGPLLFKNGKAYINYAKYAYLARTMKKGTRSLIGFGKKGEFYFIYTPTPMRLNYGTLSIALEKCRMFDYVVSLDGGGSCLLYYKGKFIAKPGRKIPAIIAVPRQTEP